MPTTRPHLSATNDDAAFRQAMAALATLPIRERNAVTAFIFLWLNLPRWRRAIMVKTIRPELKDDDIALVSGCSRRSLLRWPKFQALKAKLAGLGNSRRTAKRQAVKHGKYRPLDHIDYECHGD